jgi:hypothetical protein
MCDAIFAVTPAHFATYLDEPWYKIIGQWSELAFHSEEINPQGTYADLVVLLKAKVESIEHYPFCYIDISTVPIATLLCTVVLTTTFDQ